MNKLDGIVFYGRGCINSHGHVFVKTSDYKYWFGCKVYTKKIELRLFLSRHLKSQQEYSSAISEIADDVRQYNQGWPFANLRLLLENFSLIWKSNKNLIHFFYFPNSINFLLFVYAKFLGRRVVSYWGNDWERVGHLASIQNSTSLVSKLKVKFYKFAQHYAVRKSNLSIFAGKQLFFKFQEISINALETKPFLMLDKEDISTRLDTCNKLPIQILYVGTFTARKGVADIIPVAKKLRSKGISFRFNLVGQGPLMESLVQQVKEKDLENHVSFAGYIGGKSKLQKIYQESDILFLPSHMEGFPRVVYEAMGQHLPIVCTNVGSIPMMLEHKINAMICEPGNLKQYVASIGQIITDSLTRRKMLENNHELLLKWLDEVPATQHCKKLEEIFYD